MENVKLTPELRHALTVLYDAAGKAFANAVLDGKENLICPLQKALEAVYPLTNHILEEGQPPEIEHYAIV